ncbi:MAG: ABC transporter ATP-binding protein [Oligoflexus sp.]
MSLIEVKKLSRHFGEGPTRVNALSQVDLQIAPGEFTALVGPSGSGKSTLLHLIGGLDQPSEGEVYLNGTAISKMSPAELCDFRRDHIGFIFQSFNLIPVLTVLENIEYVMLLQGIDEKQRRQRSLSILEKLGLQGLENRRPNAISGGQQQRVAVARAVVSRPKIILADEPTANLDSTNGIALIELMKQLNHDEEVTFLFSTHDEKIMSSAKRLISLRDGEIISDERR